MFEKHIQCFACGKRMPLNKIAFRCPDCNGSLEIIFDYGKIRRHLKSRPFKARPFCHSRYMEFYPSKSMVSLQEGGTPLLRARNTEKIHSLHFRLFFKNEALNPTGSFKDRGSSVEVSKALEFRAKRAVCATTGNMGASVSAYAGVVGLECSIFTPADTTTVKKEQILAYGARLFTVCGDYSAAAKKAEEAFRRFGVHLLGDYLYRREGTKSVGFEILEQLAEPDYIFCPIGNGTLISAVWKAINEFKLMGFIRKRPRLVGVQAAGCAPLVSAFRAGKIIPLRNPKTVAVAIECGNPLDGERALEAVKESGGFMVSVSDKEILRTREMLARKEGLFAEPGGAAAIAGLIKAKGEIGKGCNVVTLITGHGLKAPFTGICGSARHLKELGAVFGRRG